MAACFCTGACRWGVCPVTGLSQMRPMDVGRAKSLLTEEDVRRIIREELERDRS